MLFVAPIVIIGQLFLPASISAQNIIDPADIVTISSPRPNSFVRDNTEVVFTVFDNDRQTVPAVISILDASCVNPLRTLLDSNVQSSQATQVKGWNTRSAFSDGAALPDGQYCLRICAELQLGASPYLGCNSRLFSIRNTTNAIPQITSTPVTVVQVGQTYRYEVIAIDADRDPITIQVTSKPDFLNFSGNVLQGTATTAGNFPIIIKVTDEYGASSFQQYTLTVRAPASTDPTDPTEPTPDPILQPVITIISPNSTTAVIQGKNRIEWSVSDPSRIQELIVEYRAVSSEEWQLILRANKNNQQGIPSLFEWDTTNISPGNYILRVTAVLEDGSRVEALSDEFVIESPDDIPGEQQITIYGLVPANGARVESRRPEIKLNIAALELDLTIKNIVMTVAGNDITGQCALEQINESEYTFICTLLTDLEFGENDVDFRVINDEGDEITRRSWFFVISEPVVDDGSINFFGLQIPAQFANIFLVIFCLLLLLLIIPLILLTIWRRRRSTVINNYDGTLPPPTSGTTVNSLYTDDVGFSDTYGLGDSFTERNTTDYAVNNTYDNSLDQNLAKPVDLTQPAYTNNTAPSIPAVNYTETTSTVQTSPSLVPDPLPVPTASAEPTTTYSPLPSAASPVSSNQVATDNLQATSQLNPEPVVQPATQITETTIAESSESKPGLFSGIRNSIAKILPNNSADKQDTEVTTSTQTILQGSDDATPLAPMDTTQTGNQATVSSGQFNPNDFNQAEINSSTGNSQAAPVSQAVTPAASDIESQSQWQDQSQNPVANQNNQSPDLNQNLNSNQNQPQSQTQTPVETDTVPQWLNESEDATAATPVNVQGSANIGDSSQPSKNPNDSDDSDDGSDPYGFGEYTIGSNDK